MMSRAEIVQHMTKYLTYATRKCVRRTLPKQMAHVWAWRYFDFTTALPYSEWHLQIITAPYTHLIIVRADFIEIITIDGEETAGHSRRWKWARQICRSSLQFGDIQQIPTEMHLPIERTPMQFETFDVAEIVVRYDIDDGAHYFFAIILNTGKQWLQPTSRTLTVGI